MHVEKAKNTGDVGSSVVVLFLFFSTTELLRGMACVQNYYSTTSRQHRNNNKEATFGLHNKIPIKKQKIDFANYQALLSF
jgi:hypothetical protein